MHIIMGAIFKNSLLQTYILIALEPAGSLSLSIYLEYMNTIL